MSQRRANLYADFTLLRDGCAIIYRRKRELQCVKTEAGGAFCATPALR